MKTLVQLAPGMYNWVEQCVHFGKELGERVSCPTCKGRVELKVFSCMRFGKCTPMTPILGDSSVACCNGRPDPQGVTQPCPGYQKSPSPPLAPVVLAGDLLGVRSSVTPKTWSYGVTAVPERMQTTLPLTLASLRAAGFDSPRLFLDGADLVEAQRCRATFGLEVTAHWPRLKTFGNWVLTLWELYLRRPDAERYAIFQDDMVAVKNLRAYLDSCPYPDKAYLNLYQYGDFYQKGSPGRFDIGQTGRKGGAWYESPPLAAGKVYHGKIQQRGLGAVALVFSRDAVVELLGHPHLVKRPQSMEPDERKPGWLKGETKVDGGIVESMSQAGWREWVHDPALVQHIGEVSSMGNSPHPQAPSFPGEGFDALDLLP